MSMNFDLAKAKKKFCENITAAFSQEYFVMGMISGEDVKTYVLTPQHAKRLAQYLSSQVAEYEKKHGAINAEWKPGIESPIKTNDVSGGK